MKKTSNESKKGFGKSADEIWASDIMIATYAIALMNLGTSYSTAMRTIHELDESFSAEHLETPTDIFVNCLKIATETLKPIIEKDRNLFDATVTNAKKPFKFSN